MILALGGYAESGKDEFADAMIRHDPRWYKTYMSYSLELALLALDPYVPDEYSDEGGVFRYSTLHHIVGYAASKKNSEVRRLLQNLGTQVGRNMFGDNVWVDKMLAIAKDHEYTIVTGVRYKNELQAITENGGISAWVSRPGVGPINSHSSDNSLTPDHFQYHIENNASLEKLAALAYEFSTYIIGAERHPTPIQGV